MPGQIGWLMRINMIGWLFVQYGRVNYMKCFKIARLHDDKTEYSETSLNTVKCEVNTVKPH